jgi:hypothetical protein
MITPIQTRYRGYRFRSRLEARWAVAFDAMGLRWEYEPEGFVLPSGKHYLPDFRVTLERGSILWFEVKPEGGSSPEFEAFMAGSRTPARGAVLHDIPDPELVRDDLFAPSSEYECWFTAGDEAPSTDYGYRFCACPSCGVAGFEFEGRAARLRCGCAVHEGVDRNHTPDHPKIVGAFEDARGARFEHEEGRHARRRNRIPPGHRPSAA